MRNIVFVALTAMACSVHSSFTEEAVATARDEHPDCIDHEHVSLHENFVRVSATCEDIEHTTMTITVQETSFVYECIPTGGFWSPEVRCFETSEQ